MTQTISILLKNRHSDAERVIGLFSATGYEIKKMNLSGSNAEDMSKLVIVTDAKEKNLGNFLTRLRQQVRVLSVEAAEGDRLPEREAVFAKADAGVNCK